MSLELLGLEEGATDGCNEGRSSTSLRFASISCSFDLLGPNQKKNQNIKWFICIAHDGTNYISYATAAHATMDPTLHYNVTTDKLMSTYFQQ